MNQISRNNHYVPQLYLKQWSDDGTNIWSYRLLISHENVPKWSYRSIKETAYIRDLYTIIKDGKEIDNFEKWMEENFEQPAVSAILKVKKNNPLNHEDWINLARFLGAQDIRTPLGYIGDVERWERTFPEVIRNFEKSLNDNKHLHKEIYENKKLDDEENFFKDNFGIEIIKNHDNDSGGVIKVELKADRDLGSV
jgi:hypothetical protein